MAFASRVIPWEQRERRRADIARRTRRSRASRLPDLQTRLERVDDAAHSRKLPQGVQFEPSLTLRLSSCKRLPLSLTLPENESLFHWILQVDTSIA